MKQGLIMVIAILLLASCKDKKGEKTVTGEPEKKVTIDSTLVTDSSWGAITRNTDFEGLKQIFGSANVINERVCGPECADTLDVTIVYPGTNKAITIYWKDSAYHKTIGMIDNFSENSPYHTADGLKPGSTMNDLLRVNGQKITFSGFGWDYGGMIQSFNGGKLDKSSVGFRLELSDYSDNTLTGDTELNTDMPSVKKAMDIITVYLLSLSFYP